MKATALTSAKAETAINAWLNRENKTMSNLFEATVNNRQSVLLVNAVISFIALTGIEAGLVSLLVRLAWFVYSINLCKKGGLK
jgi:hypothetical protein